jgi:hypothetical protein
MIPFDRTRPRRGRSPILALALLLVATGVPAWAQGTPSGEYGALALGGSVEGVLAGIQGRETVVFHTYVVTIPPGSGPVTVQVEGFGSDVDLALNLGTPIHAYADADHLDTSADPNPRHTIETPVAGPLYVDVMNLLPTPTRYRLTVSGAPAATEPGLGKAPTTDAGDPLLGTFEGDDLRVTVMGGGGNYTGELVLLRSGQRYPFGASGGGSGRLDGAFVSDGARFRFAAELAGDTLTVTSDGAVFVTQRLAAADDPVLAEGEHAILTRDNALAFIEALEFSLVEVGYQVALTDADRFELLQAMADRYAVLLEPDQVVLAQSREVWSRVRAHWPQASADEREEFFIAVFVLAFGEEAVLQAMQEARGSGGGTGTSGGTCSTIDECMATHAPEAYADAAATQGCWAAAGCESYDPQSDTFTYESWDYAYEGW